jgi:hypothetical protein
VVHGGSYATYTSNELRSSTRDAFDPVADYDSFGARCCRSL